MSGNSTTTDSEQDSAENQATSSSESHSSAEEDEDENENAEYMENIENPNALVRFTFCYMFKMASYLMTQIQCQILIYKINYNDLMN